MSNIPSSTHVVESSVLALPVELVWEHISSGSFKWWGIVKEAILKSGNSALELGANIEIKFVDEQSWVIQIVEISSINKSLTFEVVGCDPPVAVTSMVHTISLRKVTSSNSTFIEWTTDFSNDATSEVVQDSAFKKLEAFEKYPVGDASPTKKQRID